MPKMAEEDPELTALKLEMNIRDPEVDSYLRSKLRETSFAKMILPAVKVK